MIINAVTPEESNGSVDNTEPFFVIKPAYIYLLRTRHFKEENVYKVGQTSRENLKRVSEYKGGLLLFQMICNNCKYMERVILKKFKKKFKQRNDEGTEYFQGDYKEMIDIIYSEIKNEKCFNNEDEEFLEINRENFCEEFPEYKNNTKFNSKFKFIYEKICRKIEATFPDYKNDQSFGGTKKLIKILDSREVCGEYTIIFINTRLNYVFQEYYDNHYDCNEHMLDDSDDDAEVPEDYVEDYVEEEYSTYYDDDVFSEYTVYREVADRLNYFKQLMINRTISINTIYDINSTTFINKIKKTKIDIEVQNSSKLNKYIYTESNCQEYEKIRNLFHCNMIINREIYATMVVRDDDYNEDDYTQEEIIDIVKKFKKIKDFGEITIDFGKDNYILKDIHKINKKYYLYDFLRKYIPYNIRQTINGEYYLLNRDYEYIGLNTKYIKYKEIGSYVSFNDGTTPWSKKENFIKMVENYNGVLRDNNLTKCLNPHEFTQQLLVIFSEP